ncbi:MAG: alkaline phosphatase family protein [Acetobacteraceae bacterium]
MRTTPLWLLLLAMLSGPAFAAPIRTVFVVAMENHNLVQPNLTEFLRQLLGNPAAPYLNSLVTPGNPNARYTAYAAHLSNAFSHGRPVHPSEPNYIFEVSGSSFWIETDADPSPNHGNIVKEPSVMSLMAQKGVSWKSYQEDARFSPTAGTTSKSGRSASYTNSFNGSHQYYYMAKHNPMAFFASSMHRRNAYETFAQLQSDLAHNTYARFNWITPDGYNDMHTPLSGGFTYRGVAYAGDQAAIAAGDNFLSRMIPALEATRAFQNGTALIEIWFDESEIGNGAAYPIPEVIISKQAKGNAYKVIEPLTHAADTRTFEEIFGLPCTYQACTSPDLSAFMRPGAIRRPEPAR